MKLAFDTLIRQGASGAEARTLFHFVHPLPLDGAKPLLERAERLLGIVDRCYPKRVTGR